MSLSRKHISHPLEAGRSIMDAYQLPPQVTNALEYTSKRLARKSLHITLIVVKNESQLPNTVPCAMPASPPHTPDYVVSGMASPSRFTIPTAGLRQLVRRGTGNSLASTTTSTSSDITITTTITAPNTPNVPPPPAEPISSPRRWILPLTPGSPAIPSTPRTPHTPSSIATVGTTATTTTTTASCATSHLFQSSSPGLESFGIRLIPTSILSPKEETILRSTISKAQRKFQIGAAALLPAVTAAAACGFNADLVRRTVQQNEILFSSKGLTLLGLDRLYSFKAALAAYARSIINTTTNTNSTSIPNVYPSTTATPLGSPGLSNHPINATTNALSQPSTPASSPGDTSRLEDAVDCLRRLILSNGGRPIPKADLHRSFESLGGVSPIALSNVENMYRRAYGGTERRGPFEMIPIVLETAPSSSPRLPLPRSPTPEREQKECKQKEECEWEIEVNARRMGFIEIGTPPPPKTQTTPVLKLNTNIATSPRLMRPVPVSVPQPSLATGRNGNEINDNNGIKIDILEPAAKQNCIEKTKSHTITAVQHKQLQQSSEPIHLEIRLDDLTLDLVAPEEEEEEEHGDRTAHPFRFPDGPVRSSMMMMWRMGNTMDTLLSPLEPAAGRQSAQLGPLTPNGYDDISPITRGEWGFLFEGETWKPGRTVGVETC
ncbi:hypothetical protein F5Y16DRAFT_231414 [Xylariaceae sp. FL0255]|nr:hypothetical protein F5Y16DRAFT_231414 [Xylariaceae sp. FL0255]